MAVTVRVRRCVLQVLHGCLLCDAARWPPGKPGHLAASAWTAALRPGDEVSGVFPHDRSFSLTFA